MVSDAEIWGKLAECEPAYEATVIGTYIDKKTDEQRAILIGYLVASEPYKSFKTQECFDYVRTAINKDYHDILSIRINPLKDIKDDDDSLFDDGPWNDDTPDLIW